MTRSEPAAPAPAAPLPLPLPFALPEPCLVLLVGPAGSGKSTFAARHFAPGEVVSSDALREVMTGDAGDQSRNRAVFEALHREVERRLAEGRTTVVDATNVERHARRALVRIADRAGVPVVAIVFDLPLATVLERNARRGHRAVPADVVEHHHRQLEAALERAWHTPDAWGASEGLAAVVILDERAVNSPSPAGAGSAAPARSGSSPRTPRAPTRPRTPRR